MINTSYADLISIKYFRVFRPFRLDAWAGWALAQWGFGRRRPNENLGATRGYINPAHCAYLFDWQYHGLWGGLRVQMKCRINDKMRKKYCCPQTIMDRKKVLYPIQN